MRSLYTLPPNDMRILVIGGNGFIGTPLVRELSGSGHEVAILHRRWGERTADGVVHIQGDRNQLHHSGEELRRFAPEVIVDLILSSGQQARQLMQVAHEVRARVVAISSMDVYRAWGVLLGNESGELEPVPITEDSRLRTNRQTYAPEVLEALKSVFSWVDENYDKISVEQEIMNGEVQGTVLRLPMVYGPGDPLHRFFPLLKRIADQRSSIILAEDMAAWHCPRGYVDNVAHAIALAATSGDAAGRTYNINEEPSLPELEWQMKIASQLQWRGQFVLLPRERTPYHLLPPGNTEQQLIVSSARIRKELGYQESVPVDEAIRHTILWEQQNAPGVNPQQFDYAAEDAALAEAA